MHQWGHVLDINSLRLHGSATFKKSAYLEDTHDVSLFVDSKVQGLQLEVSNYASRAIASVIQAFQIGMCFDQRSSSSTEGVSYNHIF